MYGRNSFELLKAKVLLHEQFRCEITEVWKEPLLPFYRYVLKQKPDNRAYITNEISTIVWW